MTDIVRALNQIPNKRFDGTKHTDTYDLAAALGREIQNQPAEALTIDNPITDQMREDLIVTALEGGSNYWYFLSDATVKVMRKAVKPEDRDQPLSIKFWRAIANGATLEVHDAENEKEVLGTINRESIAKAEAIFIKDHARHFGDLVSENWDADTADVWFQLCVLKGEVVYG